MHQNNQSNYKASICTERKKNTSLGFWKNIFTEAEAKSVIYKYWILLWREQMVQGLDIRHRENNDKARPKGKKNLINKKNNKSDINRVGKECTSTVTHIQLSERVTVYQVTLQMRLE